MDRGCRTGPDVTVTESSKEHEGLEWGFILRSSWANKRDIQASDNECHVLSRMEDDGRQQRTDEGGDERLPSLVPNEQRRRGRPGLRHGTVSHLRRSSLI